jgi:hypothetical protein
VRHGAAELKANVNRLVLVGCQSVVVANVGEICSNMSRWVVSKLCLRNILFSCFLFSVLLVVLFLNRPSSLNDDVSTVLGELPRD